MANLFRWPQIAKSWYMFFFQIPGLPEWLLTRNGAKAIGDAFRDTAADKSRFPDEVLDVYRRNALLPGAMTAMLNWYRALFRTMRLWRGEAACVIEVPTLMIWGERDFALGKELSVGTEKYVRDLTVRYLTNASHWVQQEVPDEAGERDPRGVVCRAFAGEPHAVRRPGAASPSAEILRSGDQSTETPPRLRGTARRAHCILLLIDAMYFVIEWAPTRLRARFHKTSTPPPAMRSPITWLATEPQ